MMEDKTSGRPGQSGSCGCGSPARPVINDVSDLHSHVRDASEFSDVNRHRSDPRDRVSTRDPQTRANRASDERGCGTDSRIFRDYDWSALIPFVDLEHEVVLVEDERDEPDRRSRPQRRLKVIDGLEVFEAIPPDQGGGLNIKSEGPGGIPPAPSEGLDLKGPKVPIVFGKDIKPPPKPPITGGTNVSAAPTPQKGIQVDPNAYICPGSIDYWHSGAKYRLATSGKDMCSSGEADAVNDAFVLAYQIVRAAELEMKEWIERSTEDKRFFWQAYTTQIDSTLESWFGSSWSPFFEERFALVYATLVALSFRFRHGFYSTKSFSLNWPVTFSCRPELGGGADHTALNTINLKNNWFNFAPTGPNRLNMSRVLMIVHEMMHWCRVDVAFPLGSFNIWSVYLIQDFWWDDLDDRTDDTLCTNTNDSKNRCYRPAQNLGDWEWGKDPVLNIPKPFIGDTGSVFVIYNGINAWLANPGPVNNPLSGLSAPARLVLNFENQVHDNVMHQMMGNIDNFVCYLWNRWLDHGYCKLVPQQWP